MKKKMVSIMLMLCLSCSLFSCGKSSSSNEDGENENTSTVESDKALSQESSGEPETESAETSLSDLEQYLLEQGAVTGERTDKTASLIGAVAGFGYGNENVEVYEYDLNSDAYKNLKDTNTINVESLGVTLTPAAINENYVLIFSNDAEPDQNIVDIFNSYGK